MVLTGKRKTFLMGATSFHSHHPHLHPKCYYSGGGEEDGGGDEDETLPRLCTHQHLHEMFSTGFLPHFLFVIIPECKYGRSSLLF